MADNGPKCSVAYLIDNLGDSLISGEAMQIDPNDNIASSWPRTDWKAGGGASN